MSNAVISQQNTDIHHRAKLGSVWLGDGTTGAIQSTTRMMWLEVNGHVKFIL